MGAEVVRIEYGVYARMPTSAARVRLLVAVATLAPRVEVHAPIATDGRHRGRIVFDVPRRAMRTLGFSAAEPGDRFTEGTFLHAFFDDEALITEAERADLTFVERRGSWVVLQEGNPSSNATNEEAEPFVWEAHASSASPRRLTDSGNAARPSRPCARCEHTAERPDGRAGASGDHA